jgi:predicted Zn finger-like uncharacterized protein
MILVCPSCDTRYFAEDSAVGKEGRRVRCASCGHSWFAKAPEDGEASAPEDAGLTREQVERLRQTAAANSASSKGPHSEFRAKEVARRKKSRAMAAWTGWGAGLVIFLGFVGGLVVFRDSVVSAWPQAASAFRMVGLDVNRFGLQFINVGAKRSFEGTTPVLTVTGQAVNHGSQTRMAPRLRVSLRDEKGKEVAFWEDTIAGVASIAPGQTVDFTTLKKSPPLDTFDLQVTFAANDPNDHAPKGDTASVPIEGQKKIEAGHETSVDGHVAAEGESGDEGAAPAVGEGETKLHAPANHDPASAPPPKAAPKAGEPEHH